MTESYLLVPKIFCDLELGDNFNYKSEMSNMRFEGCEKDSHNKTLLLTLSSVVIHTPEKKADLVENI